MWGNIQPNAILSRKTREFFLNKGPKFSRALTLFIILVPTLKSPPFNFYLDPLLIGVGDKGWGGGLQPPNVKKFAKSAMLRQKVGLKSGEILFICFRVSNIQRSRVDGIILKTLLVWTQIFYHTDKKDAFSKISGYVWTGPEK